MTPERIAFLLSKHEYSLGFDGILCDGDTAWLGCTCGWALNFAMPEDDIRLAERRWDLHRAEALAAAMKADGTGGPDLRQAVSETTAAITDLIACRMEVGSASLVDEAHAWDRLVLARDALSDLWLEVWAR